MAGRASAIALEQKLYRSLVDDIFAYVETDLGNSRTPAESRVRLRLLDQKHSLARIVLADARYGGVVVRLLLFNVIHFGYIVAGLTIITVHAPVLLYFVLGFLALTALVSYPITLRAVATTRQIEDIAPQRAGYVRRRLGQALGKSAANVATTTLVDEQADDYEAETGDPASEDHTAFDRFARAISDRLRIVEYSRFTMGILFTVAVAAIIVFMLTPSGRGLLDYGSILMLFLSLRFVLNGIEGVAVTVISINRFLPHLMRLKSLVDEIRTDFYQPNADNTIGNRLPSD